MGAQAIGLLTHATPVPGGGSLTEGYLTQPNLMGHLTLWRDRLVLNGTLNLEGLTLLRGELNPGIWGEGYVDRRHPHTFLHEAMATGAVAGTAAARSGLTLSFGKGFVPFGTDDPMVRPFVKYPANHHLAQILERLTGIVALRHGPVLLEGAIFNGDEPGAPTDLPDVRRFGDSWAARATLLPRPEVELSGSYAFVTSPELPAESGLDHRKWSAAARYEVPLGRGGRHYALLEWARTDELVRGERSFTFNTLLGEAAVQRGGTEIALRYERTLRPEGERLADLFRTPQPHSDVHVLGITRWQIVTAGVSSTAPLSSGLRLRPLAEVSHSWVRETLGSPVFAPVAFYGADRLWSISLGARVEAGTLHPRMGRYGAAAPDRHTRQHDHTH